MLIICQGRTLEEVDELFGAKLRAWQFKNYQTHGAARALAEIEKSGDTEALDRNKELEKDRIVSQYEEGR